MISSPVINLKTNTFIHSPFMIITLFGRTSWSRTNDLCLIKTIPQPFISGWELSDNDTYTFQIPPDWKQERTLFNGGQTLLLSPVNNPADASNPHWSITIQRSDLNASISAKEAFFEKNGFKKGNIMISGHSANLLTGTLLPGKISIFETHIFLQLLSYFQFPWTSSPSTSTLHVCMAES